MNIESEKMNAIAWSRWATRCTVLTGLALLIATLFLAASAGSDGAAFSEASVRGSWGFNASGTIVPPAAPERVPAVAVGIFRFDGSGGCEIRDTINVDGATFPDRTSATCSYFVTADGRGEITASFAGDPAPVPLSFVIVDGRREIRFVRTDLGVASGVARRQRDRGDD